VHTDNARHHAAKVSLAFIEQNEMKRAPHPLYSSDLAASDFFLFDYIKRILSGCYFESTDDLLSEIQVISASIEKLSYWTFLLSGCEGWSNVVMPFLL
jgi:hypothetical protein